MDPRAMTAAEAAAVASNPGCYAVIREETVLACLGVTQTFPGAQGVAFALLGKGIGRDHHVLTRFLREVVIGQSTLARIEAIVRCADVPAELTGQLPMMTHALQHPTAPVRWALAVGLEPVAVLRKFGAAGEDHMLFERIR
jgi:hypothetical protein